MLIEDLLVIFICRLFSVVRSRETLEWSQGVGGPLTTFWGEEWGAKEIHILFVAGRAVIKGKGGRTILEKRRQSREFNPTKGYPGEDVNSVQFSH